MTVPPGRNLPTKRYQLAWRNLGVVLRTNIPFMLMLAGVAAIWVWWAMPYVEFANAPENAHSRTFILTMLWLWGGMATMALVFLCTFAFGFGSHLIIEKLVILECIEVVCAPYITIKQRLAIGLLITSALLVWDRLVPGLTKVAALSLLGAGLAVLITAILLDILVQLSRSSR